MRILICDDVFPTRKILGRVLQEFGSTDFAENGRVAVDAVRMALEDNDPYQLICLDVRMPEMDGSQTLAAIRKLEADDGRPLFARIVMITGVDDKSTIFQSFRSNCDGYLIKPVKRDELFTLLANLKLVSQPSNA